MAGWTNQLPRMTWWNVWRQRYVTAREQGSDIKTDYSIIDVFFLSSLHGESTTKEKSERTQLTIRRIVFTGLPGGQNLFATRCTSPTKGAIVIVILSKIRLVGHTWFTLLLVGEAVALVGVGFDGVDSSASSSTPSLQVDWSRIHDAHVTISRKLSTSRKLWNEKSQHQMDPQVSCTFGWRPWQLQLLTQTESTSVWRLCLHPPRESQTHFIISADFLALPWKKMREIFLEKPGTPSKRWLAGRQVRMLQHTTPRSLKI